MKYLHFCGSQSLLTAIALIVCLTNSNAQNSNIVIIPPALPNGDYTIGVNGLGAEDLVFYRFSDGYDLTGMNSSSNPIGSTQRKFNTANTAVSAFIARKSGPIELRTANVYNPACSTCPAPPSNLLTGEYLHIRRPSWDPFIEPANPLALKDDKTIPTVCYTPTLPWFFLPVTMKAPQPNSYTDINIPSGMTIVGAVVKNLWTPMNVGQGLYTINDPDVQSFAFITSDKIRINLTSLINHEFNVYFIVKSSTILGQESTFSAQLYNASGQPLGVPSQVRVVTQSDPHDPNILTAFEQSVCATTGTPQQLRYRVDFQNLGAGKAETVKVMVKVNADYINTAAFSAASINGSHHVSQVQSGQNFMIFTFDNINLPGLALDPQPSIESTKGWVEFTMDTWPCLPTYGDHFSTNASVTFIGNSGNFNETIATNTAFQSLFICGLGCASDLRSQETEHNAIVSEIKCYPTLFNDHLTIEMPFIAEKTTCFVTVSDLTGRIWLSKTYQSEALINTVETIETTTLPPGMYLLQARQGKLLSTVKLIKGGL